VITPNQISNVSYSNSLLLNNLTKPDRSPKVIDLSGGYNYIDFFATHMMGPSVSSTRVMGTNGFFETPIIGISVVIATVATQTLINTTTLRLTWTDPNYDNFRDYEVVGDGTISMNQGQVIAHGPGFIDITVAPPTTAWNTATQFLAGAQVLALYPANPIKGSVNMTSLYEDPVYVSNQTSLIRENLTMWYIDGQDAWMDFAGDYWYTSQDQFMLDRFAREREFRGIWSNFGTVNSPLGGVTNYSMGLRDAIRDPLRGGYFKTLTNLMTPGDYTDWIGTIADRQNLAKTALTVLCGRGFLDQVQNFPNITNQIIYTGTMNTLGGAAVEGFDVYETSYAGIKVKLVHVPMFNDEDRFPQASTVPGARWRRMQYTAIALDLNSYPIKGGGVAPAIEKRHFGPQDVYYQVLPGVAMTGNSFGKNMMVSQGALNPVTDTDAITFSLYSNCCYDFIARNMGWIEMI
jgi:hypothetical protein